MNTTIESMELTGIKADRNNNFPAWETEWSLFGPIPNPGNGRTWPGEIGFKPLPLDGAESIPDEVEMLGKLYKVRKETSINGIFRFADVFGLQEGVPIVYMMTVLDIPKDSELPICFGANWGTQWWINGELVYETKIGNWTNPEYCWGQQFCAPVKSGKNVVVVKVIAGEAKTWMITMSKFEPRDPVVDTSVDKLTKDESLLTNCPYHHASHDYAHAGLRIEQRPGPVPKDTSILREKAMADHHVHAHWIGIVDPTGSPYAESDALPPGPKAAPGNAELIRYQVEEIHKNGMAAMTWFPGVHCLSAAEAHPEWKGVPLVFEGEDIQINDFSAINQFKEDTYSLCPNSPYGEALIQFILESLGKYKLDGFWFDGTFRSGGSFPTCICEKCQEKFKMTTGLDSPEKADWSNPVFRQWVAWRYQDYMSFWGRLSHVVKREFPNSKIVINHLHRLYHSWYTSIPLNRYDADVIAGSESQDDPFVSAFHSRQQRAYGKSQAEVWMGVHKLFTKTKYWPREMEPIHRYQHHAMSCMTAGVMPSYGTPDPAENLTDAYDTLSALINPRYPYIAGESEPYCALLLSQQAETLYFSRRSDRQCPEDYWNTVYGWHNLMIEKQFLLDVVFDDTIDPNRLNKYPVFIAPYAVAFSARQLQLLEDYVRNGGVLVTDEYFGACDEWGETANPERVSGILGHPANSVPHPDDSLDNTSPGIKLLSVGKGFVLLMKGNIGLAFLKNHNAQLADEIGQLISKAAPPKLLVKGPRKIHIGLYRHHGKLYLHIQNFIAYSESAAFPNPILTVPEPVKDVEVSLRGYNISGAKQVLRKNSPELAVQDNDEFQVFTIPEIQWGEIIELTI